MKPVAVLGSGPAGLLAAWALMLVGRPTVIFSDGGRSRVGPAQFLHGPLPGIAYASDPDAVVKYVRRGDPEVYRHKAFYTTQVPWRPWTDGSQPPERDAWSMDKMYGALWALFEDNVNDNAMKVTTEWLDEVQENGTFDGIISSIPKSRLCRRRVVDEFSSDSKVHRFLTQDIVIHPEAFEGMDDNTVIYDGTKDRSWYRTSLIFGQGGTEWNAKSRRPRGLEPTFTDSKPIWTNCDCVKGQGILCVGRRGKWSVEELAHNAFYDTMTMIGLRYGR